MSAGGSDGEEPQTNVGTGRESKRTPEKTLEKGRKRRRGRVKGKSGDRMRMIERKDPKKTPQGKDPHRQGVKKGI